jgi:hypothetical protein
MHRRGLAIRVLSMSIVMIAVGCIVMGEASERCPRGSTFWKVRPGDCAVTSLYVRDRAYSQADLSATLATPARGDASVCGTHQVIGAKLNIAEGDDLSTIGGALTRADRLLSRLSAQRPAAILVSSTVRLAMGQKASLLARYNHGALKPHCTP